jgi:hypothetical protein
MQQRQANHDSQASAVPPALSMAARLWRRHVWTGEGNLMAAWVDYLTEEQPDLLDEPIILQIEALAACAE